MDRAISMSNVEMLRRDYCRKLEEIERLKAQNDRLRREKRILERYRDRMRKNNLDALKYGTVTDNAVKHRWMRYGILAGMMGSALLYTILIYAAVT